MDNQESKSWFNIQGKYIIKTTYNPNTQKYETIRHPWNLLPLPEYINSDSNAHLCEGCKLKKK